jgi:hypothetical protein
MQETAKTQDLPPDNASRLAIYDAIYQHAEETGTPEITDEELFERVIGRLRVLVPRELHLAGDRAYVDQKIDACVQARIVAASAGNGRRLLALTGQPPMVRYPDGEVHAYKAGLELARERLDRDNARLRAAGFDVREFIPSIADDPDGAPFKALLASMSEHGFMNQFPIVRYEDGEFVDGRARYLAAAILELKVEYYKPNDKARKAANRRDTPLNRVLVGVHSNVGRLPSDTIDAVVDAVYKAVADVTKRAWEKTAADLELTQEWRKAMAAEYTPFFDVKMYAYRKNEEPTIQVTGDRKVMVRSLVEAGGLQGYKVTTQLGNYVPLELARTAYSGGPKAYFARAEDLIAGIDAMQQERRAKKRKLDPRWEQIYDWLVREFPLTRG